MSRRRGGWRNRIGGWDSLVETSDCSLSEPEASAGLELQRGKLCPRSEWDGCDCLVEHRQKEGWDRETKSATLVVPEGRSGDGQRTAEGLRDT